VNGAFGAKPGAFPRYRHMAGISAVKIFAHDLANSLVDALAQRITDIEIFPRDAK
jgi:hypothetical protein